LPNGWSNPAGSPPRSPSHPEPGANRGSRPGEAPIKVLMTADAVGGVWNYALQLASVLRDSNVQVVLATMGPPPSDDQRVDAAALSNVDLRISTCKLEWMPGAAADVRAAAAWLRDLERETRPDIIHLNGYAHAHLPWRAPVIVVAHSCVASWWRAVHGQTLPDEWDGYVQWVTRGLLCADRVVTPTHAMREALARLYAVDRQAAMIPNCRSGEQWRPAPKEPFVLGAGRIWDPAKNVGTLASAARGLPWPVRLAGEMTSPTGGAAALRGADLLGRLRPSELADLMARAAIYALPARYEPFGLSVLEAALSGCALVLGDIDTLRENWDEVACFVAPDDIEGLHAVLRRLIESPSERQRLGSRARQRALERFSPERHRDRYLTLYRQLVARDDRIAHPARPH
jgi:glycogen synthase